MKVSLISVDVSHRSQVFTMIYFDMGSYNKLHVKATNKHYRSWHFAVKADSCCWLIDIHANSLLRLITCMYTCVPKQLNYRRIFHKHVYQLPIFKHILLLYRCWSWPWFIIHGLDLCLLISSQGTITRMMTTTTAIILRLLLSHWMYYRDSSYNTKTEQSNPTEFYRTLYDNYAQR